MGLVEIGILVIFIGFILVFLGSIMSLSKEKSDVRSAGGIFIGPIPLFGWATDRKMFYFLFVLAIVVFVLFLMFRR